MRRYNKKAATTSAAAFFEAFELGAGRWVSTRLKPVNRQFQPVPQSLKPGPAKALFQRFTAVVVGEVAFVFVGLDFLANGRILLFPEGLPPVLDTIVEVLLTHVAGFDGTRAAASQHEQE